MLLSFFSVRDWGSSSGKSFPLSLHVLFDIIMHLCCCLDSYPNIVGTSPTRYRDLKSRSKDLVRRHDSESLLPVLSVR